MINVECSTLYPAQLFKFLTKRGSERLLPRVTFGTSPSRIAIRRNRPGCCALVELIIVSTGAAASAVEAQTRTIPIVFIAVGDVVTNGRVRNVARPEGNRTGFTNFFSSMGGKWVELLKEAIPSITQVALINDVVNGYYPPIESAADALGVRLTKTPVKDASEIENLIDAFASEPNGGLLIIPGVLGASHRDTIVQLGLRHRLPMIFGDTFAATDGGLLAYGPSTIDLFRRAPSYVDRLLRGAKVSELPVQFPTKFELMVNLKTAKAIGLTIPEAFLLRADKVIE